MMHIYPQDGHGDRYPRPRPSIEDYRKAAACANLKLLDRPPVAGEKYIAGRNTGIKLLTAESIHPQRWVVAKENYYSFDTWECIAVEELASA